MAQAPFEIIASPATIWVAPFGTSFPAIDAQPSASFILIGKSGNQNFSDAGVKISSSQTIVKITPDGMTIPAKIFRTSEEFTVEVTVWDMTSETMKRAFNENAITDTPSSPGVAGNKAMSLVRGAADLYVYAVLVQFPSPYLDGMYGRFEIAAAVHTGNPEMAFKKGTPSPLNLRFESTGAAIVYRAGTAGAG